MSKIEDIAKELTVLMVGKEDTDGVPSVGAQYGVSGEARYFMSGDLGRLFVTPEELTAAEVWQAYESTRGAYNK